VAQAARLVGLSALAGDENGYSNSAEDVMFLDLRDPEGMPITPVWRGYALTTHEACPLCRRGSS
jgi:hypothetical protein